MKRARKVLVVGLALVVLLLVSVPLLLPSGYLREQTIDGIAAATDLRVDIREVGWQWWPRPAVQMTGIELHDGDRELLSSEELALQPALGGLLKARLAIGSVWLQGVKADLPGLRQWLDKRPASTGNPAFAVQRVVVQDLALAPLAAQPLVAQLGRLDLDLRLNDQLQVTAAEIVSKAGDARLSLTAAEDGYALQLQARDWGLGDSFHAAELTASALLPLRLADGLRINRVRLDARELSIPAAGLELRRIVLRGRFQDRVAHVNNLQISTWGGELGGVGLVRLNPAPQASPDAAPSLKVQATLHARNIDLAQVMQAYRLPVSSGTISGQGKVKALTGEGGVQWQFAGTAEGKGVAPAATNLLLDQLSLALRVDQDGADIGSYQVSGYQGTVAGTGTIHWRQSVDGQDEHPDQRPAEEADEPDLSPTAPSPTAPSPMAPSTTEVEVAATFDAKDVDLGGLMQAYRLPVSTGSLSGLGELAVQVSGAGVQWTMRGDAVGKDVGPATTRLLLDRVQAQVRVDQDGAEISRYQISGYQGNASGNGTIQWARGLDLDGVAELQGISLEPLLSALEQKPAKGVLSGTMQFSLRPAQNPDPNAQRGLALQGKLVMADGYYPGVDLRAASKLMKSHKGSQGGTAFDKLSTRVSLRNSHLKLRDLKITSALLAARGKLDIKADAKLKGEIEVGGNDFLGATTVPLKVSGTLHKPSLRPTASALLGGAVGTAVLGPGLGTAVGTKAAKGLNKIKSLFGGGNDEDDE